MTAKQWLSRGRGIDREINLLLKTKDETFERLISITANTSGDVVSGTKDPHKFDKLIELGDKIDQRIDELVRIKSEIFDAVSQLKDWRQREVLMSRYIRMKKWEEIALEMNYSYMQITRIHGEALSEIKDVIECYITPAV